MRVAFLGNHDVGIAALQALLAATEVTAVVAHPPDPEDGVRYASVHDFARARELPVLRGKARDAAVLEFLRAARPDLLWITDYRYLLPAEILALAPAVNLHPSLLPRYRGRAPVNWAILEGESELGLTAHLVDAGMDSGDILAQARFNLGPDEDVGDALAKLLPLYGRLTGEVIAALKSGRVQRLPQDERLATTRPARRPEDGEIDWNQPVRRVHDLVRAVAAPYPGAFSWLGGDKVRIWRARPAAVEAESAPPGAVVGFADGQPLVRCADGLLRLLTIEAPRPLSSHDRLGTP